MCHTNCGHEGVFYRKERVQYELHRGDRRAAGVRHRYVDRGSTGSLGKSALVPDRPCDHVFSHLGVVLMGTGRSTFTSVIRKVTFMEVPGAYKTGIPLEGKVIRLIDDQWHTGADARGPQRRNFAAFKFGGVFQTFLLAFSAGQIAFPF